MLHIPHGATHIRILMHAGRVAPWTMTQSSYPRPVLASGYCRCVHLSLRLSVHQSVCHQVCRRDKSSPVQARITKLRSLLFLRVIDLDLQGQILLQTKKFTPFWVCELVCAISHHWLRSGFPNLDQICISALSRSLFILGLIDLDLQFF